VHFNCFVRWLVPLEQLFAPQKTVSTPPVSHIITTDSCKTSSINLILARDDIARSRIRVTWWLMFLLATIDLAINLYRHFDSEEGGSKFSRNVSNVYCLDTVFKRLTVNINCVENQHSRCWKRYLLLCMRYWHLRKSFPSRDGVLFGSTRRVNLKLETPSPVQGVWWILKETKPSADFSSVSARYFNSFVFRVEGGWVRGWNRYWTCPNKNKNNRKHFFHLL
jgi:hypothetical protein